MTALLLLTSAAAAQAGPPFGLQIRDAGGNVVGQPCGFTTCTPKTMTTTGGDSLIFRAWGNTGNLYVIAHGGAPALCQTITGVTNPILMQAPTVSLYLGVTNGLAPSTCFLAKDDRTVQVPQGLPPGFQVIVQGVGLDPVNGPILSVGIEITIN